MRKSSALVGSSIDLFCGAGGITQGFKQAGFSCLYGNDFNAWAVKTFHENHREALHDDRPIEDVDAREVRREVSLDRGELTILAGGAPCQGFSINAPERFIEDPRNALFRHYVRFLDEFAPRYLLFENVPGMLSLADGLIFHQILAEFRRHGYGVEAKILFAPHYGVPQERWRLIVLGTRESEAPPHPTPMFAASARANFRGSRTMTFQLDRQSWQTLPAPPTVSDAIADLPRIRLGEGGEFVEYDRNADSAYALKLRGDRSYTYNHVASRLSDANVTRMRHVPPGGSWRDIPESLLPEGMKRARRSDHTKRYGRLRADGLASTIMTKCDPHWGPVFLPDQDRALTVREAARIQSFPDSYRFLGPRVSQYEQVGNAVPVLMAQAIADAIATHAATAKSRAAA